MAFLLEVFCISLLVSCTFQQAIKDLKVTVEKNVHYEEDLHYSINSSIEYVLIFSSVTTKNPFRIYVESEGLKNEKFPALVVVRQEKEVTSWSVPFPVEISHKTKKTLYYKQTARTMCHNNLDNAINPQFSLGGLDLNQSFIVALSTSSPKNMQVTVRATEKKDFYVLLNEERHLNISPSQPEYFFFEFLKDSTDTVIVEVDSSDTLCLTVSIQESKCPILDTNKDITYEGNYQTISTKGAITISKKKFPNGFFIVFVAKPDNYDCSQDNSVLPIPRNSKIIENNIVSNISFTVKNSINRKDYLLAVFVTLGELVGFVLITTILLFVFSNWGSLSKMQKENHHSERERSIFDNFSQNQIDKLLEQDVITLRSLAQFPKKDKRKSFNYLWHILSTAIFYSIPVVQLVITYQRTVNFTGNMDMCYYNFLCAHPILGFSDFNHIYSNIGYVMIGIGFIVNVAYRHNKMPMRFESGIPVHFGLFYSMGVALIIEGLLSACYHICPSQSNYQFDTSFMYIMAVLCMIKLYQNRHPDINASAYATFTVLGGAIFLAMVGILNGSLAVWIGFVVIYSLLCIYLSFKIYFLSFVLEGFGKFKEDFNSMGFNAKTFAPVKKARFIILVIANIANYTVLILGIVMYDKGSTDFGTFLLGLLMGNSIIHAIFYTVMKLVHKEKLCIEAIIYGVAAIGCWAAATVFFLDASTLWTVTPAESRQWNQGCIIMNFYDKHDVWHLLSAPALYFTFMFLMCLDDDLVNTPQDQIEVF